MIVVTACHSGSARTFSASSDPQVIRAREEGPIELLRGYIAEREEEFRSTCSTAGRPYTIEQDTGAPEREIIHQASGADFVIIGRHGMHGDSDSEYGLGHVAYQVATQAPKPTLIVPAQYRAVRTALVAFDGGAPAGHALELACDLCDSAGGAIHLLVVAENEQTGAPLLGIGERYLKRRGVSYEAELRIGSSEGLIIDAARDIKADMIALGGQHRSLFMRFMESHTLDRVLEYAECPLLVYR